MKHQRMEMATLLPLPTDEQGRLLEHVTHLTPLEDLVLPRATRSAVGRLLAEHRQEPRLKERGLTPANRVLFYGPPGTGKTATAGGIALALGIPLVSVRQDALVQSYMGKTSQALRQVFEFARTNMAVILIDEADALARARTTQEDTRAEGGEMARVVTSLLVMLEEQRRHSQSIVIAATNHEGVIDHAMWRRFDAVVRFEMPDNASAAELMARLLRRHGFTGAVSATMARSMRGLSFADVERVTLDAVKATVIEEGASLGAELLAAVERHHARGGGVPQKQARGRR